MTDLPWIEGRGLSSVGGGGVEDSDAYAPIRRSRVSR